MKEITLREAREKAGLTLRKASEKLGISHAYLSGLELGHKPLLADRAKELTKLYKLPGNTVLVQPLPEDKEEFVEWLSSQIKWWDSRFVLPMMPAVTRPISQLFVDPIFTFEDGEYHSKDELLRRFFDKESDSAFLIKGNMGAGKSLFLRMLTLEIDQICDGLALDRRFVPILVSLGEFRFHQASPLQSLVAYYEQHGFTGSLVQLERFFRQCIERGKALLLFDGLDEITDHSRRVETLARLQQYFESQLRPSGNRMIISGREDAFFERDRTYNGFKIVQIERWRADQMRAACVNWSFEREEDTERFFHIIQVNETIYNLAKWPLLFHLLATLYSTSGLKPFLERSGLYEACCLALENTWDSARRTFQRTQTEERDDPLAAHPWLKWRHFLIHLMQRNIEGLSAGRDELQLAFTPSEMKDAWESFLTEKGVARRSLDFARLEDLISNQKRIGPMYHQRAITKEAEGARLRETYSFIDPVFGIYYYSKALINRADRLDDFVVENVRKEQWSEVLPLTIEELGRSDRSYENQIGEKLISVLIDTDDELGLEHKHGLGHFGLLTATRSVLAYSMDKHWTSILEPFLNLYMNSMFEADGTVGNRILGEFSASNRLRDYFLNLFDQIFNGLPRNAQQIDERKWRVLAALGRFGEKTDFIVEELLNDIGNLVKRKDRVTLDDKINIRRLMWSLRQFGRSFVEEEGRTASEHKSRGQRIRKIQEAIQRFVTLAVADFIEEVKSQDFGEVSYWDSLTVVVETQTFLQYHSALKESANQIVACIDEYFDVALGKYPHKLGVIQFLKGVGCAAHTLKPTLRGSVLKKLSALANLEEGQVQDELRVAIALFRYAGDPSKHRLSREEQYREAFTITGPHRLKSWIDLLRAHADGNDKNYVEIGMAISGIHALYSDDALPGTPYTRSEVTKTLLKVLNKELALDEIEKDAKRTYTAPFTSYGYPLYDHIYVCIIEISRHLPLQRLSSGRSSTASAPEPSH